MPALNHCAFIGNLTRNPEPRTTTTGKNSANFGLAITERYNGQETTTFLDFTAWDTTADFCTKYLTKGRLVYIEAKARQDTWTDKNGTTQRKTRFTVRTIQALDTAKNTTNPTATTTQPPSPTPHQQAKQNAYQPQEADDDIPF